jgi:hypothetical protein
LFTDVLLGYIFPGNFIRRGFLATFLGEEPGIDAGAED